MSASAPVPAPQRVPAFRYANFSADTAEDLDLMSEIWLLDVCGAPWVSREAQKLAAYIVTVIGSGRSGDVYLRDFESLLNIQPEETNRGLRLLKTFRALEDFHIDKGKLTLSIRVGSLQRLHMMDARDKLRSLTGPDLDTVATRNVAELRSVVAVAKAIGDAGTEPQTQTEVVNG